MPDLRVSLLALVGTLLAAPAQETRNVTPLLLNYAGEITDMEDGNADGLPERIFVDGRVLYDDHVIGFFAVRFQTPPTMQPLPSVLADNAYGIPAGTTMPAWEGPVYYYFPDGQLMTWETAFVFPEDPTNTSSKLCVLSTSTIVGGTMRFHGVVGGEIITDDGYDGQGSLEGEILSRRALDTTVPLY